MPPRSQISLYCPNSAAEAAGISSSELYSVSFRALACPRIFTRICYIHAYIHVRARARAYTGRPTPESRMNRLKKRAGIARAAIITSRSFILARIEMHGGLHKRIPRYRATRFAIETQ